MDLVLFYTFSIVSGVFIRSGQLNFLMMSILLFVSLGLSESKVESFSFKEKKKSVDFCPCYRVPRF